MQKRPYPSYEIYIEHQASKIKKPGVESDLLKVHKERIQSFAKMMTTHLVEFAPPITSEGPKKALCAGARKGEEVKAMVTLGYDAIGVDLSETFPHVVQGDFNKNLPFKDETFDVVFSNSIDHIYCLDMFSTEMTRITKPGAVLMFCISFDMGGFESLVVDSASEIETAFTGFKSIKHCKLKKPDIYQEPYTELLMLQKDTKHA